MKRIKARAFEAYDVLRDREILVILSVESAVKVYQRSRGFSRWELDAGGLRDRHHVVQCKTAQEMFNKLLGYARQPGSFYKFFSFVNPITKLRIPEEELEAS